METERDNQTTKEGEGVNDRLIQKGLKTIYANQDGTLPDISHLDVRRRNRWLIGFLGAAFVLAVLGGIAWLGFSVFSSADNLGSQSVELRIEGEQNIASGDEVSYTIRLKNIDKTPLRDAAIIVYYPDGFTLQDVVPAASNDARTHWEFGVLDRGQEVTIEIRGTIIGQVGSLKSLSATASFQPENFNSVFKENAFLNSQITSSIITLQLEAPAEALAEKKIEYVIRYQNTSEQDLEHVDVRVQYPTGFIFQSSEPESFTRQDDARNLHNRWVLERLGSNQEGEIRIQGGFLADDADAAHDFKVQIGFEEQDGNFAIQQEQIVSTRIIQPGLTLRLVINGSSQNQPVNFGQALTYTLVYKNEGERELDDVEIGLEILSEVVDWDSLEDKNDARREGSTLRWGKDEISGLDLLRPGSGGEITLTLDVLDAESIGDEIQLRTESKLSAKIIQVGELVTEEEIVVEADPIVNNINTDLELKIEARYFTEDNIAVGTGPLPPVVGQQTTFRMYWSIANSLHEVTNATVQVSLPPGIEWANKFLVSRGSINYSDSDRIVTWSIPSIPVATTFDDAAVWFDVAVVPTKDQVRKLLILAEQPVLNGTDAETEAEISRVGKAVTSNLEDDPIGFGRGLVVDITE